MANYTYLDELVDRCQDALNDATETTWTEAVVEEWIRDAFRDYSQHFRRSIRTELTTVAGQHNYELPADFRGMVSVAYPWVAALAYTGDPPFLARLSRRDPRFWASDDYYDVEDYHDASDYSELWISANPADDEEIRIHYAALYPSETADLATGHTALPILIQHEPIIVAFVIWRAHQERLATEAQNPDRTIRMLQQIKLAVQAAEYNYRQLLRRARDSQAAGGPVGPWQVDTYDRIY